MALKHLDLGCGTRPKNPFGHADLHGVDIRADSAALSNATIATANLSVAPIPYADNFFEHIPRVAIDYANQTSRFPFIELMNGIWRVLKPDGILYSVTPDFPHEKALRDPTHVNFITPKTHRYFTAPEMMARMYGFEGEFRKIRQCWVHPRGAYEPTNPGLGHRLRAVGEKISCQQSHLVWEFAASKPAGSKR